MATDMLIIVPCYNEENNIFFLYEKLTSVLEKLVKAYSLSYKLLFIDDGSTDKTPDIIQKLALDKPNLVDYIVFSRNFGKESALFAGLSNSKSDYTVVMDADLQDPPELLEEMFTGIKDEGYDCVAARRTTRAGEPVIRSFLAKCFYFVMQKISGLQIVDGARDFRMINRRMLEALLMLQESNRFSKGLFPWVGFKTKWLEYENVERRTGNTKWSFFKLLFYAFDGISAFSTTPLTAVSFFGLLFMLFSFFMILFIVIRKMLWGDPVAGWPSLVCLILFTSGMHYFFIGVLGFYIAKIYNEVKLRPKYLIKSTSLA